MPSPTARTFHLRPAALFAAAALLLTLRPAALAAEEACKMETLKSAKLPLAEAYAKAEKQAKAWKADAVPARLGNTSMGPLDAEGKSEAWNFQFYSPAANAHVGIQSFRGMWTCWAEPGEAGRIPDLKAGFLVDGARLYAFAKEHGAALLAKGYQVEVQTAAAPETRHATWYINYSDASSKSGGLSVIVDANTGKVEKVMQH